MLDVGWFTAAAGIWRRGDDIERQVRFPIPAYLIETTEERILVDTGLHPGAAADPARHYDAPDALAGFQLELEASIAEQIDLTTITTVVMTHLHFDHAGALSLLSPKVPVIVQYRSIADQVTLVDGDHDLLGDGSVELLLTPGHTPGHQSVRVGERLILGGDVSHYASGLDDHRFPVFADDHAAQAASAERLRALRDAGADVRPGHDPAVLRPGPVPA